MELLAYLRELGLSPDEAYLREALGMMMRLLMEVEVSRTIDASHYERTHNRAAYRNGYRQRKWRTRYGDIKLHIPKLRQGTYTPAIIHQEAELALLALIQEAYISGVDYRDVARLLEDFDIPDVHPSEIAAIVEQLDETVRRFRQRPLDSVYPYLWLDVVEARIKQGRRFVAVAVGLRESGEYDVVGFEIGVSVDDAEFWRMFLGDLAERGLYGVQLVISNNYNGLKSTVRDVLRADWQFSRAKAIDEVLRYVPLDDQSTVAAAISTIFVHNQTQPATDQLQRVVSSLQPNWPQASAQLGGMGTDMLTYLAYPQDDWLLIASTNVMARVKQAMSEQADAIGIFPNTDVLEQWVSADLLAIETEWQQNRQPIYAGIPELMK